MKDECDSEDVDLLENGDSVLLLSVLLLTENTSGL